MNSQRGIPSTPKDARVGALVHRLGAWLCRPHAVEALILLTLVGFTLGERTYIAVQRNVAEAGDTFNFLFIAQAYSQGRIPQGEKRLPLYPLIILAGWKGLGFDPLVTAKAISVIAGAATTGLLYLLGRRLGIRPFPLALLLLLQVLVPVSNDTGIRPLSDSLFLFLVVACTYAVTVAGSSRRAALLTGGLIGLLLLTRFESMVLAPVFIVLLFLRLPWRRVLVAAIPVVALYIAWIPYSLHVHGSIGGGYFTEWSGKEGTVGGKLEDIPKKLEKISGGLGWLRPWEEPTWQLEQGGERPILRTLQSAPWWMSICALIGVPWLLLTARRSALPFLGVFFAFSTLYSMWVVYGRFVAPGIPAYYLAAAAGASALFTIAQRLFRPLRLRLLAVGAVTAFLFWIFSKEAPALAGTIHTRAFDNEGSGYSLYLAVWELQGREGRVAFNHDLMAILYLGIIGEQYAPPQRAIMLGEASEVERGKTLADRTAAHVAKLQELDVRYLVERGEPRVIRILEALKKRGIVTRTEEIRFPIGYTSIVDYDVTRIHTLSRSLPLK